MITKEARRLARDNHVPARFCQSRGPLGRYLEGMDHARLVGRPVYGSESEMMAGPLQYAAYVAGYAAGASKPRR